jgi:hypothetical protein
MHSPSVKILPQVNYFPSFQTLLAICDIDSRRNSYAPPSRGAPVAVKSRAAEPVNKVKILSVVEYYQQPHALFLKVRFTQPLTERSTRSRKIIFPGRKHGQCLRLTSFPPSVSRLHRHCGILNISQPYRPQRPVTGIALCFSSICFFQVISTAELL